MSYALKTKLGNTKFLAKLEWVREAKVIAQLKFDDSKEDELGSAGLMTNTQGLKKYHSRDFTSFEQNIPTACQGPGPGNPLENLYMEDKENDGVCGRRGIQMFTMSTLGH